MIKKFIMFAVLIVYSNVSLASARSIALFNFSRLNEKVKSRYNLDTLFKDDEIEFELTFENCYEKKYVVVNKYGKASAVNAGERLKYISEIKVTKGKFSKEIIVGAYSLTGNFNTIHFKNNCTELVPILFESFKKQKYFDNILNKGDKVEVFSRNVPIENNNGQEVIRINDSGYFERPDTWSDFNKEKLRIKSSRSLEEYVKFINNFYSKGDFNYGGCFKIDRRVKNKKNKNYLYDGESFSDKEVYLQHISYEKDAASLYFGHRLCSNYPDVKLLCDSFTPYWLYSNQKEIPVRSINEGIKCSKTISDYEEKNKIKIPISPFLEKEDIKKIKNLNKSGPL